MRSIKELKRRIKSVKNIQQITRAMKMITSARIKKLETRLRGSKPYFYKFSEVIEELMGQMDEAVHPLMPARPVKRRTLLVISADKGLCGAYNTTLLKAALEAARSFRPEEELELVTLGQKAHRFFLKRDWPVVSFRDNWAADYGYAEELAGQLIDRYVSGATDEIVCVYGQAVSALIQRPMTERLLPLAGLRRKKAAVPYIFEPSPEEALGIILPRFVEVKLFQMLLEGRTSEMGARLRAMSNATDNAEKLAQDLTLEFFRARQDTITREIIEVASGAEQLKRA